MDKSLAQHSQDFIMGRQILEENTKFTNEIVHSIKSKDVEGMKLKLDFEKVFDYVD